MQCAGFVWTIVSVVRIICFRVKYYPEIKLYTINTFSMPRWEKDIRMLEVCIEYTHITFIFKHITTMNIQLNWLNIIRRIRYFSGFVFIGFCFRGHLMYIMRFFFLYFIHILLLRIIHDFSQYIDTFKIRGFYWGTLSGSEGWINRVNVTKLVDSSNEA